MVCVVEYGLLIARSLEDKFGSWQRGYESNKVERFRTFSVGRISTLYSHLLSLLSAVLQRGTFLFAHIAISTQSTIVCSRSPSKVCTLRTARHTPHRSCAPSVESSATGQNTRGHHSCVLHKHHHKNHPYRLASAYILKLSVQTQSRRATRTHKTSNVYTTYDPPVSEHRRPRLPSIVDCETSN